MYVKNERTYVRKPVKGEHADLWALGITIYFLACGRYPNENAKNLMHLKDLVLENEINLDYIKQEPIKNLLRKMLVKDPSKRISLEDIISDPWISNANQCINLGEVE